MTSRTAPLPNLRVIGGEMFSFSDEEATHARPTAGGLALMAVLARAVESGSRVLLAGPHDQAVVAQLLAKDARVSWLMRSNSDAMAAAQHFHRDPRVEIIAGCLSKLTAEAEFDVVVALDGLGRLSSVEGADLRWSDAADQLVRALRPGGTLLLTAANRLDLHDLVTMRPGHADDGATAWTLADSFDPTRPDNLAQLRGHLHQADLRVRVVFAAYPTPTRPTVLLSTATLADRPGLPSQIGAVVAAGYAQRFAGMTVLADPRALASTAISVGLGAELAPAWLAVARRDVPNGQAQGDLATAESTMPRLPAVLVADEPGDPSLSAAYELRHDDRGTWYREAIKLADGLAGTREPAGHPARWTPKAAGLVRDPGALTGPIPAGRLVEEVLIAACLRRDQSTLRGVLTGYAGWLESVATHDLLADEYALATTRNVVVDGDGFAVLDPSLRHTQPLPRDVVLARGLHQVAVELVTGGYPHPWPSTVDANGLTVILCAMAGHPVTPVVIRSAVEVEVAVQAALRRLDTTARAALANQLTNIAGGTPRVDLDSHRDLRLAVTRQAQEIANLQAKLAWYDELLSSHQWHLARAQETIEMLRGSVSFWVGWMILMPARLARRAFRKLARRARSGR